MDASLTWYQAMQLIALGPCLFILFFLCVTARNVKKIVVPVLYFLALSCSFLLPIADALGFGDMAIGILRIGESLTAALSFLLIIEFITGNIPSPVYWGILALPLIGGSSIIYVTLVAKGEVCIYDNLCTEPAIFKQFYEIFSSSLIFLLIVAIYNRLSRSTQDNPEQRQQKHAIIVSLIALNLSILAIKLLYISGHVDIDRARFAVTVARIGFIYLVLTFIFRVFDRSFGIDYERVPTVLPALTERDLRLAENVKRALKEEKVYREMELSREGLAKKLAVTENQLSRVINKCFSRNFSTLINSCRIEEARERLVKESTPVTTIAFEVGFNSIPSFNRVFKQMTGSSPSEYRSRLVKVED